MGHDLLKRMNGGHHEALSLWGLSRISPDVSSDCLDAGCGGGANIIRLLSLYPEGHVTGIDYSSASVQHSMKFCRKEIVDKYGISKVKAIVEGGKERYHSVFEGLKQTSDADYVLIHDGARPFVNQEIIRRCMLEVPEYQACVVGMPVKDTIKIADEGGYAKQTPDRKNVWMIQTPQTFSYALIYEAYEEMLKTEDTAITDDAMVLERIKGKKSKLIEGSYRNIKITTPEDLLIANVYLQHPE